MKSYTHETRPAQRMQYSTDKLGGPAQIKEFVGTVERLGYDTLWYPESRGYGVRGRRVHAVMHVEVEDRQFDRQHLRAGRIHLPPGHDLPE